MKSTCGCPSIEYAVHVSSSAEMKSRRIYKYLENQIEDELDDCMLGINHRVKICSSVDCSASGLPDTTVVLVSRLMSGDYYELEPRLVNVWMWS